MALTPEEQAELEQLELMKLERQRSAALSQNKPKEADWRGRGTALTQGATFGWGDEITAAAAAGMAKLAGDERGYGDIYRDIKEAETGRQKEYVEENPGEAMALELTGAVAMPGRMLMGGKLPKTVAKSKPWQAHVGRKAARRAEETALQGTRRRVLRNTGRGAATGAFTGAGYAETMGDIPAEAAKGAAIGVALPLAMSGGRNMARFMGRRRVDPELGHGSDFMPIHLSADPKANTAADLYRRWVGRAFLGRKQMGEQEARYVAKAQGAKDTAKKALEEAQDARTVAQRAQRDFDPVVGREAGILRRMGARESLPSDVPANVRNRVNNLVEGGEMGSATQVMDSWWRKNGFGMVKGKDFEWDGAKLFDDLNQMVKEMPEMALELDQVIQNIPGMAQKMQRAAMRGEQQTALTLLGQEFGTKRKISGDALLAMRNVFARAANRSSDGFKSGAMRRIANDFDGAFRRGLNKEERALFDEHIKRWGVKETFKSAVEKSGQRNGVFGPDEWERSLSGDSAIYGTGPLQKAARRTRRVMEGQQAKVQQRLDKARDVAREKTLQDRRLGEQLKQINQRALPKEVSPTQQVVATAGLGSIPGLLGMATGGPAAGGSMALATGALHAGLLSAPWAQRAVAGQAGWQKAGQKVYGKMKTSDSPLAKALRGGTNRTRSAAIRYLASDEEDY